MLRRFARNVFYILLLFLDVMLLCIVVGFFYIALNAQIDPPTSSQQDVGKRTQVGPDHYTLGNNYLKKNEFGIWEMYIEGDAYERGLIYGELARELIQRQEDIFVAQINRLVPGKFLQQFLRLFIGFFNAKLPDYIPEENQLEIYGISTSFSDRYDYIAPKYTRILNYHAAHDIGHALNDYSVVGCTSFALKGAKSEDGQLLIARNFDFYVGDEFAEDKMILFVNPEKGYSFASYSWAGFTGVVSGLNDQGLSVTINAAKSDLPVAARMPISLLAREILQYASTIDEAVAIARKRSTFVSETLLIGSAGEGDCVLIEKSPSKMGVFRSTGDELICANHYQSEVFADDPINLGNIRNSDSHYRFDRVNELLASGGPFNPLSAAEILRDQYAAGGDTLGMGNPRAINQLIAHHSVVILPQKKQLYISTKPYQIGAFIRYDLDEVFASKSAQIRDQLPASSFMHSEAYTGFLNYRSMQRRISGFLMFNEQLELSEEDMKGFLALNGELYESYELLGRYCMKKKQYGDALSFLKLALAKNLPSEQVKQDIELAIAECSAEINE